MCLCVETENDTFEETTDGGRVCVMQMPKYIIN